MAHAELSPSLSREDLAALQPPIPRTLEHLDQAVRLTFVDVSPIRETSLDPSAILDISVRFLEQRRAIAGITEALHRLNVRTRSEFATRGSEVIVLARRLTRIDPVEVLARDARFVKSVEAAGGTTPGELPEDYLQRLARGIRSLLAACPIDELVKLGEDSGLPDQGHRCRLSYDWLSTFVRRHAPDMDPTKDIVGQAYAEGRLNIDETTSLLMIPVSDAVAWLEEHGYARDVELIKLDATERSKILARIRDDRIAGSRAVDDRLAVRDVVATQRIEDIDARPWISVP